MTMRKTLQKPPIFLALCLAALMAAPVTAEEIVYPGAQLQEVNGDQNSLAPSGSAGVYGYSKSASLTYNNIVVNGGVIDGSVTGAFTNDGVAAGNSVIINGGTFNGYYEIHGGYSDSGDAGYAGLGVLARLDFNGNASGHAYAEAHIQGGRVKNDFRSADLADERGLAAAYDASSGYAGGHVAAGYVWNLAGERDFGVYAKYLYTHRGGDSVTLSTGDPVDFDSADSRRLRLGGRWAWNGGGLRPYVGMAWEREFDGRAGALAWGYTLPASDLEGDTGILELGIVSAASPENPLRVDFRVRGYAGAREGVTGSLRLEYEF
jgi:hypothetical protein